MLCSMVKRNIKDMSNSEIRAYQETLRNEYEVTKHKIKELIDELDSMDIEYNKTEEELNKRKNFVM